MNKVKLNIAAHNITNKVPTAVWIATLIETYVNYEVFMKEDYWISQSDIQKTARILCPKNIDNARISQWCNGDHPNNTYNYLRAKDTLRRLSKIGEFSNSKEIPKELPINEVVFIENNIKLDDLMEWYNKKYCNLNFDNDEIVNKDYYNKTNQKIILKENMQNINKNSIEPFVHDSELLGDYFCDNINKRALSSICLAWDTFSKKVGNGIISINKEASMQLQYAYILQQILPLIVFQDDESINLELETSVFDGSRNREVDIMVNVLKGDELYRIAIELKCYKMLASSGGKRGAHDIFMKDVYEDLELIEKYVSNNEAEVGMNFVMTDYRNFVYPLKKNGKCWDYDLSQNFIVGNTIINTPIGGKSINIELKKHYKFNWNEVGDYFFAMLYGK